MIISHKHRFIFVHNRKTAGSAITVFLNKLLGPDDFQAGVWYDALAAGGATNRRFRKDVVRGLLKEPHRLAYIASLPFQKVDRREHLFRALNGASKASYSFDAHPTAEEIRAFDPAAWQDYYKFCFVRNPYERVVSDFIFRAESRDAGITFLEFLNRLDDPSRPDPEGVRPPYASNWDLYTLDGKIAVDFVGKYEHIERDLKKACNDFGYDYQLGELPVAKRIKRYDYRDYYGEEEREMADRMYAREVEAFGYAFDPVAA